MSEIAIQIAKAAAIAAVTAAAQVAVAAIIKSD